MRGWLRNDGAGAPTPGKAGLGGEEQCDATTMPTGAAGIHETGPVYRRVTQMAEDQAIISSSWMTLT